GTTRSTGGTTSIGTSITAVGDVIAQGGTLTLFFHAEDGIRNLYVTGVQTCALPIFTLSIPTFTMSGGTVNGTALISITGTSQTRSEERRVGKECRSRWWPNPYKKKKSNYLDTKAISNSSRRNVSSGSKTYCYNSSTL